MTLTDQEASTKWCPQVRCAVRHYSSDTTPATGNAEYNERNPQKYAFCIGSSCMMWRWDSRSKHSGGYPGFVLPKEEWTGYCGLGGKP